MKVSVIIPTYNRPVQLKQAFDSVCRQTRKPDEIIIIDDASDSQTNNLIQNLIGEEIKIKTERNDISKGACYSRNRGAQLAEGDILMFLDDDDTWESEKIASQLNVFAQNPDVGLVYSGRLVVSDTDREKVIYKISPKAQGNLYPQILYENLIGTTSSSAIKKSLFHRVGGFDEELPALQDYDLWIRLSKIILVAHDNGYNVRYTVSENKGSQISQQSERQIKVVQQILSKYNSEILSQGFLNARKIKASMLFYVAKSLRNKNWKDALPWIWKSFTLYPNLKTLALILPLEGIRILKSVK